VINTTFSEFLRALIGKLATPPVSLGSRPAVIVPIAQSSIEISADEFSKDRRHFEILGSFLAEVSAPSVADSLNGHENWASFRERHFIARSCKSQLRAVLEEAIHGVVGKPRA